MRRRTAALALSTTLGVTLLGCSGGSGGSAPLPPASTTAPSSSSSSSISGPADDSLSEDEIADIEKALDEIDVLLDDLDAELRAD